VSAAAQLVFDGHNDVLLKLYRDGGMGQAASFVDGRSGAIDLPKTKVGGLKGVRAALQCFTKAKTQMKLHPNEFIELILKARGPWTMAPFLGVPPLIFYLLACGCGTVTPASRSVDFGPWL
jgi:hypothetical protein